MSSVPRTFLTSTLFSAAAGGSGPALLEETYADFAPVRPTAARPQRLTGCAAAGAIFSPTSWPMSPTSSLSCACASRARTPRTFPQPPGARGDPMSTSPCTCPRRAAARLHSRLLRRDGGRAPGRTVAHDGSAVRPGVRVRVLQRKKTHAHRALTDDVDHATKQLRLAKVIEVSARRCNRGTSSPRRASCASCWLDSTAGEARRTWGSRMRGSSSRDGMRQRQD